jgi:hypothetical protein
MIIMFARCSLGRHDTGRQTPTEFDMADASPISHKGVAASEREAGTLSLLLAGVFLFRAGTIFGVGWRADLESQQDSAQ